MTTTPTIDIRDESAGSRGQSYHLARVAQTCGRIVRARVHRDYYLHQSTATVEVLADDMTWTNLADAAPDTWVHGTPPPAPNLHPVAELDHVVGELLDRAARILAPIATR